MSIIFCNGMVRSGSTLQYNLVCSLFKESHFKYKDLSFIDSHDLLINRLNSEEEKPDAFVVKAHTYYPLSDFDDVKRLYIYRDLRDVAASLKRKLNISNEEILEILEESVEQYKEIKKQSDVLIQKYEEVYSDIESSAEEIASYLELGTSTDKIKRVCNEQDISNVQKRMKKIKASPINHIKIWLNKMGFNRFRVHDSSLIHYNHISITKGKSNSWDGFLDDQLISKIESEYIDYMLENGYLG